MSKIIPEALVDHVLPFNWDVRKVWAHAAPIAQMPLTDFVHLLELPLWSSLKGRGLLFDVRPIDVIRGLGASLDQRQRVNDANLDFPIDVLVFQQRRWILDGVHRIAKHVLLGKPTLPVRFHDEAIIPAIRTD